MLTQLRQIRCDHYKTVFPLQFRNSFFEFHYIIVIVVLRVITEPLRVESNQILLKLRLLRVA